MGKAGEDFEKKSTQTATAAKTPSLMDRNAVLVEFVKQYIRWVDSGMKPEEAYLCVCRQGFEETDELSIVMSRAT